MPESELLKYLVECNPSNKSELYDLQRKKTKAAVEKEIILLLRIAESNKKAQHVIKVYLLQLLMKTRLINLNNLRLKNLDNLPEKASDAFLFL